MIKQPWLIQRAKVTNSNPKPTDIFSDCISLDYMGSSEFEWGVVPATISSMHSVSSELNVYEHLGDKGLFILCLENQVEKEQQVLNDLVVYWLNGPRINNTWLCGYYTVESIQEFIKSKTGVIAQAITDIQTKTKKHA